MVVSPRGLPSITSMRPAGFVWILIVPYFAFFDFADAVDAGAAKKTNANRAMKANLRLRRIKLRGDIILPPQSGLKLLVSRNDVVNLHQPRASRFRTTATRLAQERSSESELALDRCRNSRL